jgi:hypothetical protein
MLKPFEKYPSSFISIDSAEALSYATPCTASEFKLLAELSTCFLHPPRSICPYLAFINQFTPSTFPSSNWSFFFSISPFNSCPSFGRIDILAWSHQIMLPLSKTLSSELHHSVSSHRCSRGYRRLTPRQKLGTNGDPRPHLLLLRSLLSKKVTIRLRHPRPSLPSLSSQRSLQCLFPTSQSPLFP